MSSSGAESASYLIFCIVACITMAAYFDERPWHLELVAWVRGGHALSHVEIEDEVEGPERILSRQLSSAVDGTAAGALHVALAKFYDSSGRSEEALHHLEMARDIAAAAARVVSPPSRVGNAIISAGREREGLAEARLALTRAYLERGRLADADAEITRARNDEGFVGLEELHLTEIIREQGHVKKALGDSDLAMHHYKFARSRVERSSTDVAAVELVAGLLKDEASIAHLVSGGQRTKYRTFSKGSAQSAPEAKSTSLVRRETFQGRPFAAKVHAMFLAGEIETVQKLCLEVLSAGAHADGRRLDDLEIAAARNALGKIYRGQGRLSDARLQLHGALEAALKTGSAEKYEAHEAYEALYHLQSRFHRDGTPRSLLAAQAIFRDAQRAALDAGVPESEGRADGERRLRANANPGSTLDT